MLDARSLRIDPSLGVMDQGTIDLKAPPESADHDDPHLPAAIGIGKPISKRKVPFTRKPGATLAEQLGTDEVVSEQPYATKPIDVPERPKLSAEQMQSMLTPKFIPKEEIKEDVPESAPVTPPAIDIKADLKDLVLRYIQKAGPDTAAKFFGKPVMHIHNWVNGKAEPPLAAAQAVLDKSPKAKEQYLRVAEKVYIDFESGEGSFQRDHTKEELPVDLCLCTDKDIPPYVHWVFVNASAQYGIGQKMMTDTVLIRARNMVADMFLSGKAQWAIWLDYDILPTIANAPWWRAITRNLGNDMNVSDTTASYDFIKRLLAHNKPFVGGVYATRRKGGPMVTQPDLHPRGQKDRIASDLQRKNKAQGLLEVDWLSCGFAIIHRVVFETIKKQHPERNPSLHGEPYPFFTPIGSEGEDVAFSTRAREAGFKLYLDQELMAAHIGRYPFLPGESAYNGPVDFTNAHT